MNNRVQEKSSQTFTQITSGGSRSSQARNTTRELFPARGMSKTKRLSKIEESEERERENKTKQNKKHYWKQSLISSLKMENNSPKVHCQQ